ncbi:MAG: phosphate ABC transporter permease PstA [Solirubrobacteraceae bacterium]|jgi:phosphate transport system permease protein
MATIDPTRPLIATGNLRRRRVLDRVARGGAMAAAVLAVAVLLVVIATVLIKGSSQISFDFLTENPQKIDGTVGGGIANAIIGSALLIAVATAMALPIGVMIAVFLTEFSGAGRLARPIRLALDLLNGMPTIVIGLFVFGLLEEGGVQTGFAGSFALAIIMVPLISRTTGEMLQLVPRELRDASHALGVSRWRTTIGIVLPAALGGILTGTVLAIARAAGETAPLLLTCSLFNSNATTINVFGAAVPNIPMLIFTDYDSPYPIDHARAWGAALVLMAFILVGNLTARATLARQRRMIPR